MADKSIAEILAAVQQLDKRNRPDPISFALGELGRGVGTGLSGQDFQQRDYYPKAQGNGLSELLVKSYLQDAFRQQQESRKALETTRQDVRKRQQARSSLLRSNQAPIPEGFVRDQATGKLFRKPTTQEDLLSTITNLRAAGQPPGPTPRAYPSANPSLAPVAPLVIPQKVVPPISPQTPSLFPQIGTAPSAGLPEANAAPIDPKREQYKQLRRQGISVEEAARRLGF